LLESDDPVARLELLAPLLEMSREPGS